MLEKISEKWDDILLSIKNEHEVPDVSYKTWLLPLKPSSLDQNVLTIFVPDDLFLNFVKRKFGGWLNSAIEKFTDCQCEIRFVVKERTGGWPGEIW